MAPIADHRDPSVRLAHYLFISELTASPARRSEFKYVDYGRALVEWFVETVVWFVDHSLGRWMCRPTLGRLKKLPKTLITQAIDCLLCYHPATGTGASALGPTGFETLSTPKPHDC